MPWYVPNRQDFSPLSHLELLASGYYGAPPSPDMYNSTLAWIRLPGLRRDEANESYSKYLLPLNQTRDKADRVTPLGLTTEKRMDELMLFIALSSLQANDSLRRST